MLWALKEDGSISFAGRDGITTRGTERAIR